VAALAVLTPAAAFATGDDFSQETLVARGMGARETGLEMAADLRVDRDYRVQGWFTPELELGLTSAWVVEGAAAFVNRGRGLESGGWKAESRYVLLDQPRWPLGVAAAIEYEEETTAAKHVALERTVAYRAVATRHFGNDLLATFNWGWDRRLAPFTGGAGMFAAGARYPERGAVCLGFEYLDERLERRKLYGPDLRIRLPNQMLLRLGGSFGPGSQVYRFIGRAILEVEL
jgi:hypothetical protein